MDKAQADAYILEYLPRLYGFAVKRCYSYDEAEELCAQIVETVYRALRRYDGVRSVGGYIHTIARRTYAGYVDGKRRDAAVSLDDIPEPAADGPDDVETEDELRRVRQRSPIHAPAPRNRLPTILRISRSLSSPPSAAFRPAPSSGSSTGAQGTEGESVYGTQYRKLGLKPVRAVDIGHCGNIGPQGFGPALSGRPAEFESRLQRVRTAAHDAGDCGRAGRQSRLLEERIEMLAENGFLVRQPGGRYTTYVRFWPETYSRQQEEPLFRKQQEAAALLVRSMCRRSVPRCGRRRRCTSPAETGSWPRPQCSFTP
ncbi:MAG: RNA polymerase sigma factor [Acutalibacteraceae bacterium]